MKITYWADGITISPETELEKIHMTTNVRGLVKDLCKIDDGVIMLRFEMLYEEIQRNKIKEEK